jgi:hypothetical protein
MFRVPQGIATERFKICKACKHFVESTQSCGTLILGDRLSAEDLAEAEKANEITHYRKKLRLCGCKMNLKTHISLFRCPINKWGRYKLNDEETAALREFISGLPTQGVYTQQHVKQASDWFTRMTGQRHSCSSCKANIIFNFLRESIREASPDELG